MIVQIYEFDGQVSRSVLRARLLAEVEADEDTDIESLIRDYGGQFAEIRTDRPEGVAP